MISVKIVNMKDLVHNLTSSKGFFCKESGGSIRFLKLNPATNKIHIYATDIDVAASYDMTDVVEGKGSALKSSTFEAARTGSLQRLLDPSNLSVDMTRVEERIGIPVNA